MKELIFKLSDFESIKIIPDNEIDFKEIDYCCGSVKAYFVDKQILRIGQGDAGDFFELFIKRLKQSIDNKLQLHESLTKNLGFMQNQYYHEPSREKPGFIKVLSVSGKSSFWVGYDYQIWSTYNDAKVHVATWMYNDNLGDIIFEVTKTYKWSSRPDEPEDPDFMTYEEFMKDYKPLLCRVIPREIAVEWLEQAMKVYRGFFSSEENYINRCKELGW